MALYEPKDPLLLSHRIFLGRKFDLQVNGILKYETKLPLSLNYSEVFLKEIISLVQNILVQKILIKRSNKQFGSNKANPTPSNCIESGLSIESGVCQK